MPLTMTTVTGPVYLPNGATPFGGRVSFELSSWDVEEAEGLVITGPVYVPIDANGQFSVNLFTTTAGSESVTYRMFVIWEDSTLSQSYVNNIYVSAPTPHYTKKYIGSFALSGPGPYRLSELNIVSELNNSSFDAYLEMKTFADRIDLGALDEAVSSAASDRIQTGLDVLTTAQNMANATDAMDRAEIAKNGAEQFSINAATHADEAAASATSAAGSATAAALYATAYFKDVAELIANTTAWAAGTILNTREEGFAYEVAPSGASNHNLTTAGGVKLYRITSRLQVRPGESIVLSGNGDNGTPLTLKSGAMYFNGTSNVPDVPITGLFNVQDENGVIHLAMWPDLQGDGDYDADWWYNGNAYHNVMAGFEMIFGSAVTPNGPSDGNRGRIRFGCTGNFAGRGTTNVNVIQSGVDYNGNTINHLAIGPYKSGNFWTYWDAATGNVGIGTSNPGAKLHLKGPATAGANTVLRVQNGNNDGSTILGFADIDDNYIGGVVYDHAVDDMSFYVNNSTRGTINSSGDFGIGTSTPIARLHVAGSSVTTGVVYSNQPAPTSKSAAATLTIAELLTGIIQYTGAAANLTLPTGTAIEGGVPATFPVNMSFDFSVINTGSGAATIATNTGLTLVGAMAVAAGSSGLFRARKTATNTFTVYRIS